MTAEIALLNKEAIALAADSAVTVSFEDDAKIFTSANKIFTLSKYHPIGVMIYNNASFLGVPWETIIGLFRDHIGNSEYETTEEYCSEFISFLQNNTEFISKDAQEQWILTLIASYFRHMRNELTNTVEQHMRSKNLTHSEIKKITADTIRTHYYNWKKAPFIDAFATDYKSNFEHDYKDQVKLLLKIIFEELPISPAHIKFLHEISFYLVFKQNKTLSPLSFSGIVITGFGRGEIYPSLKSFNIYGKYSKFIRYEVTHQEQINFDNGSLIIPFAQSEMVNTFIDGIHPTLESKIFEDINIFLKMIPDVILEKADTLTPEQRTKISKESKTQLAQVFKKYTQEYYKYRESNYANDITSLVSFLPKDELASVAEAFVNLTSFRRKYSLDKETVGGPIDVAVISKKDGFIWIKRKHYFSKDLNPNYFGNYFRRCES